MDQDENVIIYSEFPKRKVYINGIGEVMMKWTQECEQDIQATLKTMFRRRTPEFTEQEIKEWREAWEIIKVYDFEEIKRKYKVKLFREDHR